MVLRLQEHQGSTILRRQPQRALAPARWRLAALLLVGLAGCSSTNPLAGTANVPPCPKVAVLTDAAHLTVFKDGAGRDLTDVKYDAEFGRITGECIYNKRDNGKVTVEMTLQITARRGPADRDRLADVDYFVAVVDRQSNVLGRQEFQSRIQFPSDQTENTTQDELEQIIPLKKDQAGEDIDVLVGFKLTPEQLERNRAQNQ